MYEHGIKARRKINQVYVRIKVLASPIAGATFLNCGNDSKNKSDNRVTNLEWVTPSENMYYCYQNP